MKKLAAGLLLSVPFVFATACSSSTTPYPSEPGSGISSPAPVRFSPGGS